jgi:hypothetical protein
MKTTAKCKKCGRVLKSPLSVAMGMGPTCAGISTRQGCTIHIGLRRSTGKRYGLAGASAAQIPSMTVPPEKKVSRKEKSRLQREERRRLFEQRQAFQLGMLARSKMPLRYEPVGVKDWKECGSGKVISQDQLLVYLTRYRFI